MIQLRDYQKECIEKMVWARKLPGNDLVSLPQGSGKSIIISELAKELNEPILILVPSKELLEQDQEKLEQWTKVKIYSAGSNSKEIGNITLATIQSAYKTPELFKDFKVVIIDEADLINPKNLSGMYNRLFDFIGHPKIYGLTATPFRNDSYYKRWGKLSWQVLSIHTVKMLTRYKELFWNRMLYVKHAQDLIDERYLVPLSYFSLQSFDYTKLKFNKSKSEFDLVNFEEKYMPFIDDTAEFINNFKKQSLIFVSTISQGEKLQKLVKNSELVSSKTSKKVREKIVNSFKNNTLKHVINVGILLVGFDKPDLENIVVLRPTRSLRLWMQLLGRGMRTNKGKTTCNIYDFVSNKSFLGKAESMKIEKIDGKWNVTTDTFPDGLHYKELYSFKLKPKTNEVEAEYLEPSTHNQDQ